MKNYVFILIAFLCVNSSFAQKQIADYSLQELDQLKKDAVSADKMNDAAVYKKAIDLKTKLEVALLAENYTEAASIKEQLKTLSLGANDTSKLENDIKKAVAAEDYTKAALLKKQLDNLKNNKVESNTTSESQIPTLEFINQVYFWNKADHSVKNLEYDTPQMQTTAAGGFGYAQATSFWVVSGTRSDVTINPNESTSFILKVTPGQNPTDMFRLVRFQILGKKNPSRHMAAVTVSSAAYAGSSTKERRDNDVMISYNKIDEGYYEIIVNGQLSPGEYTFYGLGKMYSFSVNTAYSNNNTSRVTNESANSNVNSTTNYSKSSIYGENNMTWFGIDFSLFNYTFTKKMGREDDLQKNMNNWIIKYDHEINESNLKRWLHKPGFVTDKDYSENLYHTHLKKNWISYDYNDVSQNAIQNHLNYYKSNTKGIGLVVLPEHFNEDRNNYTIEFVWFDTETKAIISTQKISGRGSGGATLNGWIDVLIEATKTYIDQYYKKEKAY